MSVKRYSLTFSGALFVSQNGGMVDYEDYAALEDRFAALAAENAGLKNQLRELFNSCDTGERRGNGSLSGAAVPDWCVLEKTRQFLESAPATDAFLAEVRAQGVEMLREHPAIKLCSLTHVCDEFAAQLRQEAK